MKIRGFTLIELVTVVVLLGILAISALPKFLNINQDAHDAVVNTLFANYKSAVSLYHYCWIASNKKAQAIDLNCFGNGDVDSTPNGYPLGIDTVTLGDNGTTLTGSFCRQLWEGLLDANDFLLAVHTDSSFGGENDIIYWFSNGDATNPSTYCYYNYISDNTAKGASNWQIRYFPATGEVTLVKEILG